MFEHLLHAVRLAFIRALVAFVVATALAAAYGAGLVWLAAHSDAMQPIWLLVASLGIVAGLASAGLVLAWQAAPAIAALRGLEYLADQAPEQSAHPALPVPEPEVSSPDLHAAVQPAGNEQTASVRHVA